MTTERYLRLSDVVARTGQSKTTLWRLERTGAFPRRRRIGARNVGWLASEVDAWCAARPVHYLRAPDDVPDADPRRRTRATA